MRLCAVVRLSCPLQRSDAGFKLAICPHVPAVFASLIVRCTAFDPAQRPTFVELSRELIEAVELSKLQGPQQLLQQDGLVVSRTALFSPVAEGSEQFADLFAVRAAFPLLRIGGARAAAAGGSDRSTSGWGTL